VTLGNALCGFAAIGHVMRAQSDPAAFGQHIAWAGWMILAAMVFDALDGKVARLARATSDFGAELDSLCDVISFGVAPGLIISRMATQLDFLPRFGWAAGAIFMLCAALRLARFNVETSADEESHHYFKGLPSPAAAGFIAAMAINIYGMQEEALAAHEFAGVAKAVAPVMANMLYAMPYAGFVLAILMISNIRYIHVMNKMLRAQEPLDYLVKLILVIFLAILTRPFSLPLLVGAYIFSGLVNWVKEMVMSRLPEHIREHGQRP